MALTLDEKKAVIAYRIQKSEAALLEARLGRRRCSAIISQNRKITSENERLNCDGIKKLSGSVY